MLSLKNVILNFLLIKQPCIFNVSRAVREMHNTEKSDWICQQF